MAFRKVYPFEFDLAAAGYEDFAPVGPPRIAPGAVVEVDQEFWRARRAGGHDVPLFFGTPRGIRRPQRGVVIDAPVWGESEESEGTERIALVLFVRPANDLSPPTKHWYRRPCVNIWVPRRYLTPIGWTRGRDLQCQDRHLPTTFSATPGHEGVLTARVRADLGGGVAMAMAKWQAEMESIVARLRRASLEPEERALIEARAVKLDHLMEVYGSLRRR
jgi:hypothetical protein